MAINIKKALSDAGSAVTKFFTPKTGTLATAGRNFLQTPINVSPRVQKAISSIPTIDTGLSRISTAVKKDPLSLIPGGRQVAESFKFSQEASKPFKLQQAAQTKRDLDNASFVIKNPRQFPSAVYNTAKDFLEGAFTPPTPENIDRISSRQKESTAFGMGSGLSFAVPPAINPVTNPVLSRLIKPQLGKNLLDTSKKVVSRLGQGAVLGTAIPTITTPLLQGRMATPGEMWEGAKEGMKTSWQLAYTNLAADKISKLNFLPKDWVKTLSNSKNWGFLTKLGGDDAASAFKQLSNATKLGDRELMKELFWEGTKRLFARAVLETPVENTWFTGVDKVTGKEQEDYIKAWMNNLPANIVGNIAFAGLGFAWHGNKYRIGDAEVKAAQDALLKTGQDLGVNKPSQAGSLIGSDVESPGVKLTPEQEINQRLVASRGYGLEMPVPETKQSDVFLPGARQQFDTLTEQRRLAQEEYNQIDALLKERQSQKGKVGLKVKPEVPAVAETQPTVPAYKYDESGNLIETVPVKNKAGLTVYDTEGRVIEPGSKSKVSAEKTLEAAGIPYKRGDITAMQKQLDELLGTDSFKFNNKWTSILPARENAISQIKYYADQGELEAIKDLEKVLNLQAKIEAAQEFRKNPKLITTKVSPETPASTKPAGWDELLQGPWVEPVKAPVVAPKPTRVLGPDGKPVRIVGGAQDMPVGQIVAEKNRLKADIDEIDKQIAAVEKQKSIRTKVVPETPITNERLAMDQLANQRSKVSVSDNRTELPENAKIPVEEQASSEPTVESLHTSAKEVVEKVRDIATGKADPTVDAAETMVWKRALSKLADWINLRKTAEIEQMRIRQEFDDIPKGIGAMFQFQSGDKSGRFADVQKFFEDIRQQEVAAGVPVTFKEDYLPQLFAETPEQVRAVVGKTLGLKPGFTMKSLFASYEEALKTGKLTPKYENIVDLMAWRKGVSTKAIADRQMFNFMSENKLMLPSHLAPREWVTLDPDRFPKFSYTKDGNVYTGVYKADEKVAKALNNFLADDSQTAIGKVARFNSKLKNMFLSAGIPGTGLNFHGLNLLVRNTLSSNNPLSGFLRGTGYLFNTKAADRHVKQNLDRLSFFVKNGLTASAEDNSVISAVKEGSTNIFGKSWDAVSGVQKKFFEDPLFQRVVPVLKLERAESIYGDLMKTGKYTETEAAKIASEATNNLFGGINIEQEFRDKGVQNILRSTILAADWAETNLRIGKNIGLGLLNPSNPNGKIYRTFARNMILAYVGANLTNIATSGHPMWQNSPGNEFNIFAGYTSDGQERYIRPFGTAVDFIRVPFDMAAGIAKGNSSAILNPIKNRLSPMLSTAMGQFTNASYRGPGGKIYAADATIPEQIGARVFEAATPFMPSYASSSLRQINPATRLGTEPFLASLIEAPIRYAGGANTKKEKASTEMLKEAGMSGADIYKANNKPAKTEIITDDGKFNFWGLFDKKTPTVDGGTVSTGNLLLDTLNNKSIQDEKTKKITEVFKLGLDKDKTAKILEANGLGTFEEASVQMIKTLSVTDGERGNYLWKTMEGMDGKTFAATLKQFAVDDLLTTGVTSKWLEDGLISDDERKAVNKIINESKGRVSTSKKSFSKMPVPKSPKKIKVTSTKPRAISPLKLKTSGTIKLPPPPTMSKAVYNPRTIKIQKTKGLPMTLRGLGTNL